MDSRLRFHSKGLQDTQTAIQKHRMKLLSARHLKENNVIFSQADVPATVSKFTSKQYFLLLLRIIYSISRGLGIICDISENVLICKNLARIREI